MAIFSALSSQPNNPNPNHGHSTRSTRSPQQPTRSNPNHHQKRTPDPLVDLMVSKFTSPIINSYPPMGLTENLSPTFLSSGNPCLDFFFHVVPDTPPDVLFSRLHVAWSHNPLTTLKLVRGTGKSDKEGFYAAATWLHANHPKTLAANVPSLADFGYFKDLPEILYRLLEGSDIRQIQREEWLEVKHLVYWKKNKNKRRKKIFKAFAISKSLEEDETNETGKKAKTIVSKKEKRVVMAKKLLDRYNCDMDFRSLHDRIPHHFAECLKKDLEFLNSGSLTKISLAAKWCPSVDSSFDRSTLLCSVKASRGECSPARLTLSTRGSRRRITLTGFVEFDQASANSWETDYQAIVRKYSEKGTVLLCLRME